MSYKIVGNQITKNGQPIHLLGSNWIGAELNEAVPFGPWGGVTYKEMIAQMKSIGLNSVRIPITHRTIQNVEVKEGDTGASWIEGHRHLRGKKSMEVMDYIVDELEAAGMFYIFDHHYLEDGKIPAKWYTQRFTEGQWLGDLRSLATRYKGRKGFLAIDIKNEPNKSECSWGDGNILTDWRLASERAFAEINTANPDILVMVEALSTEGGINQLIQNPMRVDLSKVSYSIHLYGPDVWADFGEGFQDRTFPANMPKVWDRIFGDAAKTVNVVIGEWGGKYGQGSGGQKDRQWQDAFSRYMTDRGISSLYWGWTNSSGWDTGGIQADDGYRTLREDKVAMIKSMILPTTRFGMDIKDSVNPPKPPRPEPGVDPIPDVEPVVVDGTMPSILKYFKYDHLPGDLQSVSKPFSDLAQRTAMLGIDPLETEAALRKLLEAKDAAVRSVIQ